MTLPHKKSQSDFAKETNMSTALWTGLILLVLGVFVWLFGNRMWLLGAGAGALLAFGLLGIFPSLAAGTLGLLIVIGTAILFGVLGFIGKAFAKIIAWIIGFIVGGGVALGFLDMLGMSGFLAWLIALIAAVVVALIFGRFLNWALIIFAALLGSMLIVRGFLIAFSQTQVSPIGSLGVIVLTALGIFYHYRQSKPKSSTPAAPAPKS
jgi:hypothetical protein